MDKYTKMIIIIQPANAKCSLENNLLHVKHIIWIYLFSTLNFSEGERWCNNLKHVKPLSD